MTVIAKQKLIVYFIAALGAVLFLVVYEARFIFLASLIGVGLGVLLSPLLGFLMRHRVPKPIGALLFVVLIFAAIALIGYGTFALIKDQVDAFVSRAPELFALGQKRLLEWLPESGWLKQQLRTIQLSGLARQMASQIFQGLQNTVSALVGAFLVLTIALYTALRAEPYRRGFLSLFPAYLRPRAEEIMAASAKVLCQWFRSQIVVMAITGLVTTLGLWILGIEYFLLLGFLTAVFGFIPYIGAFLTGALTILVTLGTEPDKVWWVLGLYVLIQQLEGDVTIPLVMQGKIQLPEVHLIILMLVMGSLFGLVGVFLAPPLLAVGRAVYLMTYVPRMNRAVRAEL